MQSHLKILLKNLEATMELGFVMGKIFSKRVKLGFLVPHAIYLYGDLGAGKTTFTRAFVSAFDGATEAEVSSPSFTICNEYPTRPEIFHADLYRLPENTALPQELCDIEEMQEEALATQNLPPLLILEWPERLLEKEKEKERVEIFLHITNDNEARNLIIKPFGEKSLQYIKNIGNEIKYVH